MIAEFTKALTTHYVDCGSFVRLPMTSSRERFFRPFAIIDLIWPKADID